MFDAADPRHRLARAFSLLHPARLQRTRTREDRRATKAGRAAEPGVPPFRRKVLFESLEPRLLLSADVLPGAAPAALSQLHTTDAPQVFVPQAAQALSLTAVGPLEAGARLADRQLDTLDLESDSREYGVQLAAGQALSVSALQVSGDGVFDLEIVDPEGELLWTESGADADGVLVQNLLAGQAGQYTVRLLLADGDAAAVQLDLAVDAVFEPERQGGAYNDWVGDAVGLSELARPLPLAGSTRTVVVGELGRSNGEATDYNDVYAIELVAGDTLAVELSMNKQDGTLRLLDGEGNTVTASVSTGLNRDYFGPQGLLHMVVPESGTYYLAVQSYQQGTPVGYTLAVARNASLDPDVDTALGRAGSQLAYVAEPVVIGQMLLAQSNTSGNVYFEAWAEGGAVTIDVLPIDDASLGAEPLVYAVQLSDGNGNTVALTEVQPPEGQGGRRFVSAAVDAGTELSVGVFAIDGQGQFQLRVDGASEPDQGPVVEYSAFDDGIVGAFQTWQYINFDEPIRLDQLGPLELLDAQGEPLATLEANALSSDGNAVWVLLPSDMAAGLYRLRAPAGSFVDLAGHASAALEWEFVVDATRPALVASDPGPEGELGASQSLTLTFSEPMIRYWPEFVLLDGQGNAVQAEWTHGWSEDSTTLTIQFLSELPEGAYELQFSEWVLRDLGENPLDADPDTAQVDPLVLRFTTDAEVYVLPAFAAAAPLGSLVYATGRDAQTTSGADVDEFVFELEEGDVFSAVLSAQLGTNDLPRLQMVLLAPDGSEVAMVAAADAGRALLIPDVPATMSGSWKLRVTSVDGSTGHYNVSVVRGAMVQRELTQTEDATHGDNHTRAAAEDLELGRIDIAPGIDRLAAVGSFSPAADGAEALADDDFFRFTLAAGESASVVLALLDGAATSGLRLALFDDSGDLAGSMGQMLGAAIVAQGGNRAVLDFTNHGSETVTLYALARGDAAANYSLLVTRGATFDVGAVADQPQWIGPTGAVLGALGGGGSGAPADLPTAATLDYYQYLVDGTGFLWDFWEDGSVNNGTSDAYDGGLYLSVYAGDSGGGFHRNADGLELGGRQLVQVGNPLTDVQVVRKIYVPTDAGFARYLDSFTNNTGFETEILVYLDTNLGSDGSTTLVATSNDDGGYDAGDRWVVTDDWDGSGDPSMAHVLWGEGGLAPEYAQRSGDNLNQQWRLRLQPGQTVSLLHFAVQATDRATARATAEQLVELGDEALAGLTAAERAGIVNFAHVQPDTYRFWATAGDAVTLQASVTGSEQLPLQIIVRDPQGVVVLDTGAPEFPVSGLGTGFTAGSTGAYTVQLVSAAAGGEYLVEVGGTTGQPPAPRVVEVSPDGAAPVAGMPAYVDIAFDGLLRADSVDAGDLQLDPDTVAAGGGVTSVELIDGRTLRFHLGAVAAGDRVVSWSLAAGALTGFDGQASQAAAGSFAVDGTGPQVLSHFAGSTSGQIDTLSFVFSEALAADSLSLADIAVFTAPDGSDLRNRLETLTVDGNVVTVSFDTQYRAGSYTMVLGPDVRDIAGNRMDQDGDGVVGEASDAYTAEFELTNFDLVPGAPVVPTTLLLGSTASVSFTVRNEGSDPVPANRGWYDALQLVRESDGAVLHTQIYYHYLNEPLLPDDEYTVQASFTPPVDAAITEGAYRIRVVSDYYGYHEEGNEANNAGPLSALIDVAAPDLPDLVPAGLEAPGSAAGNTRFIVGWNITNGGSAATVSGFYDRIDVVDAFGNVVQSQDVWYGNTLAAGQTVQRSSELVLRSDLNPGSYTLRLTTDVYGYIAEYQGEAGNTIGRPLTIEAALLPDLANVRIEGTAPTETTLGQTLLLTYAVDNIGAGGTENVTWTDRVQLVRVGSGEVVRIWNFSSGSATGVSAGGQYSRLVDLTLPINASYTAGEYVLRVLADVNNNLRESGEPNAALELPLTVVVPPLGNLVVEDVSSPATAFAGTEIDVSWTLANVGDGALLNTVASYFYDRVYLANESGQLVYNLGDFRFDGNIAAATEVLRTQRVALPENVSNGRYRLVVLTDYYNWVNEHIGETDNRGDAAATIDISQPPRVDLQVPSVTVPATGTNGAVFTVQWESRNGGSADFSGGFTDRIQFSTSSNFSSNVRSVADVRFTGSIAAGATVQRSADIPLPIDMPGTWYVRVLSDVGGEVYEYQLENNNTGVAAGTTVLSLPPLPDLQVSDVQVVDTARAGDTVTVTYTVVNAGTAQAGARHDRIQLVAQSGTLWTLTQDVLVDEALAAGASQQRQVQLTLPLNSGDTEYTGTLRALVTTDISGEVSEYPNDNNNSRSDAGTTVVTLPPLADLRITQIAAPLEALTQAEIPLRWTVANEGGVDWTGGWTDQVWLSTDSTLSAGDRYLGGFSIDASLAAGVSLERVQNIVLPEDLTGSFYVIVRTEAANQRFEGSAGEANNTSFGAQTLTLIQRPIPNLVVTTVTPPQDAFSGQLATVSWTVRNSGNGSTSAPVWYDRVYLSTDDTLGSDDVFLGDVVNPGYLSIGGEYASSGSFRLPQGIDANYRFIVVADVYNQVFEGTAAAAAEHDNTRASAAARVRLTPPPDLRVTDIGAPPQAFSGQPVTITWNVLNDVQAPDGGRTRETSWVDRVWMSTDTTLDAGDRHLGDVRHDGALDPQEGYTGSLNVTLPIGVSGPYYFIVATDAGTQVYEHTAEANNTRVDNAPTEILLTPPPDLEIVDTDFAASARAGTTFTVHYRVENLGSTATPAAQSNWYDQAWLSLDGVIDGNDIALGAAWHYGVLDVDGGYDGALGVVLPHTAFGSYQLLIRTDGGNHVFEGDDANNLVVAGTVEIFQRRPDLAVSNFQAPASAEAGRTALFSWTVVNQGDGDSIADSWADSLWGSLDAIYGNNDDFLIGSVAHAGVLAPGGSYDVAIAPTLPFSLEGPVQFYLRADGGGHVFESNEANNVSPLVTTNVLRDEPNLQVLNATVTPVAGSARVVDISFTVRNNGSNATNANYWYDGVWLSADDGIGAGDVRVANLRHANALAPGEQYQVTQRITLPAGVPAGEYRLLIRADDDNAVIEGAGEADNVAVATVVLPGGSGSTLPVDPLPVLRPDFVVTSVSAPEAAFSGQRIQVAWTVENRGDAAGASYDQVFLSSDAFLDSGDISLGYASFGALAAGGQRQGSAEFTLPVGRSGPYYVLVKADAGDRVAEPDAEGNNVGFDAALLQITLAPPADLVAGEFTLPAGASPGQSMAVTYTVHNGSSNAAVGAWRDTLYLSTDDVLDVSDVVFGSVDIGGPIAAGGSYSRTVTATVPGIDPGTYKLIVRSDVRNVLPEASEDNNVSASLQGVALDVQALQIDVPVAGTLAAGQSLFYKIEVGAGEALRFTLDGPGDDIAHEMFVRFDAMPTRSVNDANTGEQFTADPVVTVPGTQTGTYYVRIDASPFQGGAYTLRATLVPFSVERVAAATVGNTGDATLRIDGARFDESTGFELVDANGVVYAAHTVVLADAGRAYATFDLFGAALGSYDLRATRTSSAGATLEAELADAVDVQQGVGADAFLTITGPTAVQVNRDASFYLNYSNDGDADTMAPLMIVTPSAGTTVGTSAATLSGSPLFLMGASLDGPMDLLRPGAHYTIPVAYKAPGVSGYLSLEARPVQADSTELVENWAAIEAAVRPAGVDAAEWNRFWGRVQPAIGNTMGNLVQVLNDMLARLSPAGEPIRDVRALFAAQLAADRDWMPAQQVTGQLLNAADGSAIAGATVQLLQPRGDGWRVVGSAITNADGSFAVAGIKAGDYVVALAEGLFDMNRDGSGDTTPPAVTVTAQAAPAARTLYAIPPAAEQPVVREDRDAELLVDSEGVVHMFWQRGDLYYHAYQDAQGNWTDARAISDAVGANLAVAAGATVIGGQAGLVAVWEQGQGNDTELWAAAAVKDAQGGYVWSMPVKITDGDVASYSPDVEIDVDGNAMLVFQRRDFSIQDDADLYAFTMLVDPVALQWNDAAAQPTESGSQLEPLAGQVSAGYSKEFGPYEFLGFSFRTGIEGTVVATLDEAACQTTVGLNAKGSIAIRVPGWGRAVGEGQARGSGVWNVDPNTQDWAWAGGQIDMSASVKFEIKDGLFKLLSAAPPLAPLANGLRSAMNFISSKTGGAVRLENAITPGLTFEAKDLRWSTQSPFPNFIWPDSVGEMAVGGEIGLSAKAVIRSWDAELSLEGKVGFKATVYPSLSNPQITYSASLQAKVMGWVLINGEWSDNIGLGGNSLMVLAGEVDGPQEASEFIFLWDPAATLGTGNVYGAGAIDAQVADNRVNDSPMRLARAGDGTVVGVFARDGDAVAGEIGNRLMVATHGAGGWSDEVAIPQTLGFNGEGVVSVLGDGSRVVVFSHATAAGLTTASDIDDVMAARKQSDIYFAVDTGNGFSTPVLVSGMAGSDTDLAITRGADGSMAIAWVHDDGGEQVLYTANWTGSGFGAPTEVARVEGGVLSNVTLAISGGQLLLAWNHDADAADPDNMIELRTARVAGPTVQSAEFSATALSAQYEKVLEAAPLFDATLAAAGGWFGPEGIWPPFPVPEDCKKCTPEKLKKITEAAPDCRPGGGSTTTLDSKKCEEKTITYAPCVVQPRDPNDIIGPDGFGEERWVTASDTLQYTIRFENAADATAPAQVVTVTQTLDEDLDARTFRVDDFGFASFRSEQTASSPFLSTRLDLRESQGIYVDVTARIDVATRVVTWVFTTIDPETGEVPVDATKGFLLPNDETGRGDGFISYTVKAKRTVETGARIDAEARIVFDSEGPIDTPPVFNTLDAGKPESAVEGLPDSTEDTRFTVRWGGSDDAQGSALRDYEVYVKVNDGDWSLWLFDTTDTEAVYEGAAGNRYAFYSVATDNAGNVEAAPAAADASILVVGQTASIGGAVFTDIDGDGVQDLDEAGLSGWTVFLDADGDGVLDVGEASTVTGDDGGWQFAELDPGSYTAVLQLREDFGPTLPASGSHTVAVAAGDAVTGRNFGVVPLGSVSGLQFDDTDGDGTLDVGEQGLAGWTIFLDEDGDGVLDAGERSTVTGADGSYRFDGLRAGAYRVAQVVPEGWMQTLPGGPAGPAGGGMAFAVTLSGSLAQISLPACACGGTVTTIAAQQAGWDEQLVELDAVRADPVYAGLDGHGVRVVVIDTGIDRTHPFFQGRIAYQYDFADDDADASDVNGHGTHVAGVIGGADSLFGGVASGVELIVLKVFGDDGSASFRDLERALQWVIANAEAYDIGVVNLSLGDGGNWQSAVGRYGLGDEFQALAAMNIINVAAAGNNYAQTNALGVAYPGADPAVLAIGAVWSGDFGGPWSFGNGGVDNATGADHIASFSQRDDDLLDAMAPGARLTSAAIGGGVRTMQGTSQSSAYVSGVAALAQQLAREHLGRSLSVGEFRELLVSTAVSINDGDDESDNVANSGLDFPRLDVRALIEAIVAMAPEAAPGGGDTSTPPAPVEGAVDVDLGVGEDAVGIDFGAFQLGEIGGLVFDDRDGDGVQDAGESAVAGATVFVDADADGVLDEGETAVTTGADGRWSLGDLGPGALTIAAVLPQGFEATTAAARAVTVTSGLARVDLDFGRRDIAPVAQDDSASVASGQTVTGNVLDNDADPGRPDKSLLSVTLLEGPASGSLTLDADGSFSYTAPTGWYGSVSFRYAVSDGVSADEGLVQISVLHDTLKVQNFAGRHDGFTVFFTRAVARSGLDTGGAGGDFVVTNAAGQVVAGSLFVAADGLSARFIATGGPLADGAYGVKLASGADALRDTEGVALDGNADGTPGDAWLGSFTVAKGNAISVGLADTARGPGQALGLTTTDTGLALRISNGAGVTSVAFVLSYDPALLGTATLQRGAGLPAGATFTVTELAPGRLAVQIASAAGLPSGSVVLANLVATIPQAATLGAAQVIDIGELVVNAGALAALDDDAVHVAAYPGDLDGDRQHTQADLDLMNALLAGTMSRLGWLPQIDAALLGDINGSGRMDAMDPARLAQALAGNRAGIVQLPGPAPTPTPPPKPTVPPTPKPPVVKPVAPAPAWVTPLVSNSATIEANVKIKVVA